MLPLLYYAVLGRADLSWKLARDASRHDYPLWSLLLAILPLLIPALLAYRRRARTFLGATTQAWPGAVLLLYFVSASALGATPLHAFQGISIPLAVLAVQGVASVPALRRLPRPGLIAAALIALVTIPNAVFELKNAADTVAPQPINPTFIKADERDALNYLAASKTPGGVLSRSYLGALVPAKTGRRVFVGDCLWSQPHCYERVHGARVLFGGGMTPKHGADVRQADRRGVRALRLRVAGEHPETPRPDDPRHQALRLRSGVRARRAEPTDGTFGRITRRCGCSRYEALIASSATTPTPSSTPPTR